MASEGAGPGTRSRPPAGGRRLQLGLLAANQSRMQHLRLQRSIRRTQVLAFGALALAGAVAGLLAFDIVPGLGHAVSRKQSGAVASVREATVLIQAGEAGGTGWVLDSRRRLVVASAHVINGATSVRVGAEAGIFRAVPVAVAPCEDLAVLRVADARFPKELSLRGQSSLRHGETVVALGYPTNASGTAMLTSTTGVVSVTRSTYREPSLQVPIYSNVIQTDARSTRGTRAGRSSICGDGSSVSARSGVRSRATAG